MRITCLLCTFTVLLAGAEVNDVFAQMFRRVRSAAELETGAHYVLAGYSTADPDAIYVMRVPEQTGTDVKSREASRMKTDEYGYLHVEDGGAAVFELVSDGTAYAFRDVALNAWLAYSTRLVNGSSTSLYTLTDEEMANVQTSLREKWSKAFKLASGFPDKGKTPFVTKEEVNIPPGRKQTFGLLLNGYSFEFKLYREENYGDSLFLYKEMRRPVLVDEGHGDWTFGGDWRPDSLCRLDFSQARRIDFSAVALPERGIRDGNVTLPDEYVWTYVRKGEAGRLPAGWPNVIEIDGKENEVQGRAVTAVTGCDSCILGPKYSFEVPAGTGIAWYRSADAEGWWATAAFPYEVETVTWERPAGEAVELERLMFEGLSDKGAVFAGMPSDARWEAGIPCLWRPVYPRESVICFYAKSTVVRPMVDEVHKNTGLHATYRRRDITDDRERIFLLDGNVEGFVWAGAGSWVAPCRAFLVCLQESKHVLRLTEKDVSGICERKADEIGPWMKVYGTDGTLKGMLRHGERIPESWPCGIYITSRGKQVKR